jgi:hypothetical protein
MKEVEEVVKMTREEQLEVLEAKAEYLAGVYVGLLNRYCSPRRIMTQEESDEFNAIGKERDDIEDQIEDLEYQLLINGII